MMLTGGRRTLFPDIGYSAPLKREVSRARGAGVLTARWESTESWVAKSWRSVWDNQGYIH